MLKATMLKADVLKAGMLNVQGAKVIRGWQTLGQGDSGPCFQPHFTSSAK